MKKFLIAIAAVIVVVVIAVIGAVTLIDFNRFKEPIIAQVKSATGRDMTIAGDLKLKISLTPSLAVDGVTFANAPWGSRPDMLKLQRLEAEIEILPLLSKELRVNRIVLVGLDALIETDAKGKGNWVFDTAAKPAAPAAKPAAKPAGGGPGAIPVIKKVRIQNLKLTYKDGKTGETIKTELARLDLSSDGRDRPLMFSAGGAYNGAPFEAEGKLGSIASLLAGKSFPVELQAKALGATVGVKGAIDNPQAAKGLNLAITASVPDLPDTMNAAAAIVPALKNAGPVPKVAVNFSGTVTDPKGGYAVDRMDLKVGDSDIVGKAFASLGGARPKIAVDLNSNLLDLDALMPPKKEKAEKPAASAAKGGGAGGAPAGDKRVFPDDPLPLDGLKAADAEVKFRGKKLVVQGNTFTDVSVDLNLDNGRLELKPFQLGYGGGTVAGDVVLDGRKPTAGLIAKVNVDKFDYGRFLKQMKATDLVTGKLDAQTDLRGSGKSVRALMAGLDGKIRVTSQNGKIDSKLLNIVSTDIIDAASPFAVSAGDKDLRCLYVDFDIAKGQAKSKALLVELGGISIIGTGGIDLAQEKLDLAFDPRSRKANMLKAVIPFDVKGTLASPSPRPSTKAVAGAAAKIAAGVATGGLSTVAGAAADAAGITGKADDTDYCDLAFAGKPLVPAKSASSGSGPQPATADKPLLPGAAGKVEEGVKDAVEGIGKSLKGLFKKD